MYFNKLMKIFNLFLLVIALLCSMSQAKKTLMKTNLMGGGIRKYGEYCTDSIQCAGAMGCYNNACRNQRCGRCESKGMCCRMVS